MQTKITSLAAIAALSTYMAGCAHSPSVQAKQEAEAGARENVAIREAENKPDPAPKFIAVAPGTSFTVRLNQSLSTATNRAGERFTATMAKPIVVEGQTVIPVGTQVEGIVSQSVPSGRFKGRAVLTLSLQKIEVGGGEVSIDTSPRSSVGGRHRKRNWAWIGGGGGTEVS